MHWRQWLLFYWKIFFHFLHGRTVCLPHPVLISQKTLNINTLFYCTVSTEALWLLTMSTQAFSFFTLSTQASWLFTVCTPALWLFAVSTEALWLFCSQNHWIPYSLRSDACRQLLPRSQVTGASPLQFMCVCLMAMYKKVWRCLSTSTPRHLAVCGTATAASIPRN
jgi:hypothetical protein